MKLPLKWLKEYVDFNVSVDRFVELMMWRGFETAAVEPEMPVTHTVVGRIDALSKHPNADKLQICSIDVGQPEKLTVVTGATNVFEGALVPVALDGAKLVGGLEIHPTKMRGVHSDGMLCSGQELGLTEEDYPGAGVYGILILQGEHPLGQRIQEALGTISGAARVLAGSGDPKIQALAGEFCREAGSIVCRELLKDPPSDPAPTPRTAAFYQTRPCTRMVMTAAEILDAYIREHPPERAHG